MKRPRSNNKYADSAKPRNNAVCTSKNSKSVQRILAGICTASMVSSINPYTKITEDK